MKRFQSMCVRAAAGTLVMMSCISPAIAQPVAAPPVAAPGAPAAAPTSAAIFTLIEQLLADDLQQRNDAEQKLVAMGEVTRPLLKQTIETSDNPELRIRVQSILAQMDENRVAGGSKITLHEKDISPRDLFAKVSEQCGMLLEPVSPQIWNQVPAVVTIDIDKMPFWEAMDAIGDRTGIRLTQWGDGVRLNQSFARNQQGVRIVSGPLLINATVAQYSRTINFGGNQPVSENFSVQMQAMMEPKIRVLGLDSQPQIEEAVDEKGNSLVAPAEAVNRGGRSGQSGNVWSLQARLQFPKDPGKRITRLKGSLNFTALGKSEKLEIGDIAKAKGTSKTAGPVTLTVTDFQKEGENYKLMISLKTAGAIDERLTRSWFSLLQQIQLLDAEGRPFSRSGASGGGGGQNSYSITITYGDRTGGNAAPGEPAKIVWDAPVEVKTMSIPFEFTDLPMP